MEKYRPRTLDEVYSQEKVVNYLKKVLQNPNEMSHILLYGPPGGGKTTIAVVFLKQLFGDNYYDSVLELNASDSRNLEDVRKTIKPFAFSMPLPDVHFKVCFLDEMDETAPSVQPALRRIIEGLIYQNKPRRCRFILACNQKNKIIEPIQSRCMSFFIRPLPLEEVTKCLRQIGLDEGLNDIPQESLEEIANYSNGDLRKAINTFQILATLHGDNIPKESVAETLGVPSQSTIFSIMRTALDGNFTESCEKAKKIAYEKGFTSESVITEMSNSLFSLPVDDKIRARIASILANYQVKIYQSGINTDVLLNGILAEISLINIYLAKTAHTVSPIFD